MELLRPWLVGLPPVQRHPDYPGGAFALRPSTRMPVEGLIANYTDGCSAEEIAAVFEMDVQKVRQIARHYVDRADHRDGSARSILTMYH
jgi:uncharacterized protein (DUF433 family)